jgi:hypothetical protein
LAYPTTVPFASRRPIFTALPATLCNIGGANVRRGLRELVADRRRLITARVTDQDEFVVAIYMPQRRLEETATGCQDD